MWRSAASTAETICSGAGVPGTIGEATSQNHRRYRLIHENDPTTNQSEIETRRTAARATRLIAGTRRQKCPESINQSHLSGYVSVSRTRFFCEIHEQVLDVISTPFAFHVVRFDHLLTELLNRSRLLEEFPNERADLIEAVILPDIPMKYHCLSIDRRREGILGGHGCSCCRQCT